MFMYTSSGVTLFCLITIFTFLAICLLFCKTHLVSILLNKCFSGHETHTFMIKYIILVIRLALPNTAFVVQSQLCVNVYHHYFSHVHLWGKKLLFT